MANYIKLKYVPQKKVERVTQTLAAAPRKQLKLKESFNKEKLVSYLLKLR